jgi:hypothetical protein
MAALGDYIGLIKFSLLAFIRNIVQNIFIEHEVALQ